MKPNYANERPRAISMLAIFVATAWLVANAAIVRGQHMDIDFGLDADQIVVDGDLFEAEFLAAPIGPNPPAPGPPPVSTGDPGFEADDASFAPGEAIRFDLTRELFYWDGSQMTAVPGDVDFVISGPNIGQGPVSVNHNSATAGYNAFFADAGGGVHDHMDFGLNAGPDGAYGIVMQLSAPNNGLIAPSNEFLLVFNQNLTEPQFEAGVAAIASAAAVPEPAAMVMALVGLAVIAFAIWKRRPEKPANA